MTNGQQYKKLLSQMLRCMRKSPRERKKQIEFVSVLSYPVRNGQLKLSDSIGDGAVLDTRDPYEVMKDI